MITPQWSLHIPTVFTGESHIETLLTTDYLGVWIKTDTSLTFISGFRLTAIFENIGQNKTLEFNKLQQFSFAWIPLELTGLCPYIFCFSTAAHQVCITPSSPASECHVSKHFQFSLLNNHLSSHVFLSPLPFPRLIHGSLQLFCVPHSLSLGSGLKKAMFCYLIAHAPIAWTVQSNILSLLSLLCLLLTHQIMVTLTVLSELFHL